MTSRVREIFDDSEEDYSSFYKVDGDHPLKKKVPGSYIEYNVRSREGGKVLYFNFDLAKEMGLISGEHQHKLNRHLSKAILDNFGLVIINEYDIINGHEYDPKKIKKNKYMATRYLQLQHPDNKGLNSGDGRSIWNGQYLAKTGHVWDISSCGTGATSLSPATSTEGKFFMTGDPTISYGCGYSDLLDGVGGAMMSDIFHKNGIKTERILAVIEYPGEVSVNVRAGNNLLRPSHFFLHLKQNNYERLKRMTDYYIDRQKANRSWNPVTPEKNKYKQLLGQIADDFARVTAQFEVEYIFCWLDWDGDNILTDGGIIDYGSVRQFGLFHHEYRYDDVQRWSTNIKEQRSKARYLIQTFCQTMDYLISKRKKNVHVFSKDQMVRFFDERFDWYRLFFVLKKVGYLESQAKELLKNNYESVEKFYKVYRYFERKVSKKGKKKVADGINQDAIFCMRDILRELPFFFIEKGQSFLESDRFLTILRSNYAEEGDLTLTPSMKSKIKEFQLRYYDLVKKISSKKSLSEKEVLEQICDRTVILNRYERITGDSVLHVSQKLLSERQELNPQQLHRVFENFVNDQVLDPDLRKTEGDHQVRGKGKKLKNTFLKIVKDCSEGL